MGRGVALLNQGTSGYQIDAGVASMMLLRSITNYQGYYSPQAAQTGSHTFKYSLYSHEGNWATGGVVEQAHSFNSPLRILPTDPHAGVLPPEHSFLTVNKGHFEVTALKRAEQGMDLVLRGYETAGQNENVELTLRLPVQKAQYVNLLEQIVSGMPVALHQGSMELKLQARRVRHSAADPRGGVTRRAVGKQRWRKLKRKQQSSPTNKAQRHRKAGWAQRTRE